MRAVEITTVTMREYAKRRLAGGATPATVNRDLGVLRRMFTLAIQSGRLSRRPDFPSLPEGQPRQGFMEHGEYLTIRKHLSAAYQDVLDFGYLTGWRRGEILSLEWRDVDRPGSVIRLRPEACKTREGRVLVLLVRRGEDGVEGPRTSSIEGNRSFYARLFGLAIFKSFVRPPKPFPRFLVLEKGYGR
jgi:integrase